MVTLVSNITSKFMRVERAYVSSLLICTALMAFQVCAHGQNKPLSAAIQAAREQGKSTVELHTSTDLIGSGESIRNLDRVFSVLEAVPIKTYTQVNDAGVTTWYLFHVTNVLKRGSGCIFCDPNFYPPHDAFPASTLGTILVPVSGGTAVVSGISVKLHSNAAVTFDLENKYLLILATINPGDKVQFLSAGSNGAFKITESGKLAPAGRFTSALAQTTMEFKTVQALRSYFKAQ